MFLLFFVERLDVLFCQDVALFQERILLRQLATDSLRFLLAVADGLQTVTGYTVGGIWGSLLASFSLVMPSLLLLVFVLKFLFKNKENYIVKTTLSSMKPVIAGLIFVAALQMMNTSNFTDFGLHQNNISVIICAVTFIAVFWAKINPILMILASGLVGYLIY